jgi:hypothetical protein
MGTEAHYYYEVALSRGARKCAGRGIRPPLAPPRQRRGET